MEQKEEKPIEDIELAQQALEILKWIPATHSEHPDFDEPVYEKSEVLKAIKAALQQKGNNLPEQQGEQNIDDLRWAFDAGVKHGQSYIHGYGYENNTPGWDEFINEYKKVINARSGTSAEK